MADAASFANAYLSQICGPNCDPQVDLNGDGFTERTDSVIFAAYCNQPCL